MLQEVLNTISNCKHITKVVLVSKDEDALKIGRQFNTVEIFDVKAPFLGCFFCQFFFYEAGYKKI